MIDRYDRIYYLTCPYYIYSTRNPTLIHRAHAPFVHQGSFTAARNAKLEAAKHAEYTGPYERKAGTIHLVDMPGLGYAKVPKPARKRWNEFLTLYMATRPELKMVVHLVDSQVDI